MSPVSMCEALSQSPASKTKQKGRGKGGIKERGGMRRGELVLRYII